MAVRGRVGRSMARGRGVVVGRTGPRLAFPGGGSRRPGLAAAVRLGRVARRGGVRLVGGLWWGAADGWGDPADLVEGAGAPAFGAARRRRRAGLPAQAP